MTFSRVSVAAYTTELDHVLCMLNITETWSCLFLPRFRNTETCDFVLCLNRDISSLTQFGDHSPSLSFIKTLQEVEFNFVATDQNNKIWIYFIYSPAKNFADKFNFFISWLISYSLKNNYRNIFFEERQGITPFHSLILFCIYFSFHIISFYTYLYWCRTSIFP